MRSLRRRSWTDEAFKQAMRKALTERPPQPRGFGNHLQAGPRAKWQVKRNGTRTYALLIALALAVAMIAIKHAELARHVEALADAVSELTGRQR